MPPTRFGGMHRHVPLRFVGVSPMSDCAKKLKTSTLERSQLTLSVYKNEYPTVERQLWYYG